MGILVGGGIAALVTFRDKQHLKRAGSQLYSDLRLAQTKANASEVNGVCAGDVLEGYGIQFGSDATRYDVVVLCGGNVVVVPDMGRTLPVGVQTMNSTKCLSQLAFYILAKGADSGSVCLAYGERYYKVDVAAGGEIIDSGFVDEGEVLP